jgi:hypothetical protein
LLKTAGIPENDEPIVSSSSSFQKSTTTTSTEIKNKESQV